LSITTTASSAGDGVSGGGRPGRKPDRRRAHQHDSETGGNQFKGDAAVLYSSTRFQSSNLTDDLVKRGYVSPGRLEKLWDVDPTFGGGRSRRTASGSSARYRDWGVQTTMSGNVFLPGREPGGRRQSASRLLDPPDVPADSGAIGINLSWASVSADSASLGHRDGAHTPYGAGILDIVQTHISQLKWTSTLRQHAASARGGGDSSSPCYYNSNTSRGPPGGLLHGVLRLVRPGRTTATSRISTSPVEDHRHRRRKVLHGTGCGKTASWARCRM